MIDRFRSLLSPRDIVWAVALATGLGTPATAAAAERVAAAVEIGAKGVKYSVVQVQPCHPAKPITRLDSGQINVTLMALDDKGQFKPTAIEDAVKAVEQHRAAIAAKHKIAKDDIPVVGSSGLKAANMDDLKAAVKAKTGKELMFLTPEKEVELTLLGLDLSGVPGPAVLLDVGSGNTKGGMIEVSKGKKPKLVSVSVPLGTVSFTQKVQKEAGSEATAAKFTEAATKLAKTHVADPLAVQLADKKGLAGAKHVYLTGGAVWAATTILHPEKVNDALVPLTVADLDRLLKMLADKPDSYPVADLTPITDMNARMAAEAEMLTVRKVFSRQNLVAGVTLLKAAIEALKLNDRKPVFARSGLHAWVLAFAAGADLTAYPLTKDKEVVVTPPVNTPPATTPGTGVYPTYPGYPAYSGYPTYGTIMPCPCPQYQPAPVTGTRRFHLFKRRR